MDQRYDAAFGDGLLDLGIAEHHTARLVGERESAQSGLGEQPVDAFG